MLAKTSCTDPYLEPGFLTRSPGADWTKDAPGDESRWRPFDESCTTPRLLAALKTGATNTTADLDWAKGRTIALVGDSLERYLLQFICRHLDGEFTALRLDDVRHPPVPSMPGRNLTEYSSRSRALQSVCHVKSVRRNGWPPVRAC